MKAFWGYNNEQDAREIWGNILDKYPRTTKTIDVVDDATKWPQTSSKQITLTRIETDRAIISF